MTGSNPNNNPLCGRKAKVTCTDEKCQGGQDVTVTILDKCPGCDSGSLDLSPTAFEQLSKNMGAGVVTISWSWA